MVSTAEQTDDRIADAEERRCATAAMTAAVRAG
jgi:hypothetical protein